MFELPTTEKNNNLQDNIHWPNDSYLRWRNNLSKRIASKYAIHLLIRKNQ